MSNTMTDLMHAIYEYIFDRRLQNFLPREYRERYCPLLEQREAELTAACSDSQREQLKQYQEIQYLVHSQEMKAMFLAAWNAARELG